MPLTTVVILGASGMLGSTITDVFSRDSSLKIIATVRKGAYAKSIQPHLPDIIWKVLDAESTSSNEILTVIARAQWVINAIGIIKPYIHDDNAAEIERALRVNALFPHLLAKAAEKTGIRVLQIATDCVYSGQKGKYSEKELHDPLDVYGKTKSIGEVFSGNIYHLRCSIIGPELKSHLSLLDWFLGQPQNANVNGFTNHQWNGVTTFHFAKLCQGVITKNLELPHLQHVIPTGIISKFEMLSKFAEEFNRADMTINPAEAKAVIDRTLITENEKLNLELWNAAGYDRPPTVPQMITEMAHFDYKLKGVQL